MAIYEESYEELDAQGNPVRRKTVRYLQADGGLARQTIVQSFTNEELVDLLKLVITLRSQEKIERMKQAGMNGRARLKSLIESSKINLAARELDLKEQQSVNEQWLSISKEMRAVQQLGLQRERLQLEQQRLWQEEARFQQTFEHQRFMDFEKLAQEDREFKRRLLKDLIELAQLPEETREKIKEIMDNFDKIPLPGGA